MTRASPLEHSFVEMNCSSAVVVLLEQAGPDVHKHTCTCHMHMHMPHAVTLRERWQIVRVAVRDISCLAGGRNMVELATLGNLALREKCTELKDMLPRSSFRRGRYQAAGSAAIADWPGLPGCHR